MSVEALHVLVGTALTDEDFEHDLLRNPLLVLPRFDLSDEEQQLVLEAASQACFLNENPLRGFAKFLVNSEIVRRESPFSL